MSYCKRIFWLPSQPPVAVIIYPGSGIKDPETSEDRYSYGFDHIRIKLASLENVDKGKYKILESFEINDYYDFQTVDMLINNWRKDGNLVFSVWLLFSVISSLIR